MHSVHKQKSADEELEDQIDLAFMELRTARTPKDRRIANNKLVGLVKQRSPEQVLRLERKLKLHGAHKNN